MYLFLLSFLFFSVVLYEFCFVLPLYYLLIGKKKQYESYTDLIKMDFFPIFLSCFVRVLFCFTSLLSFNRKKKTVWKLYWFNQNGFLSYFSQLFCTSFTSLLLLIGKKKQYGSYTDLIKMDFRVNTSSGNQVLTRWYFNFKFACS